MCIVLATTAHPSYALIVLDNRDEFILRPTSRPHWWKSHEQEVLSARDLHRKEQGTWLGITKTGKFAVLTNYSEPDFNDAEHPVQGIRSRGGMVTAWLGGVEQESTQDFVHRLLESDGVKGVGGFLLVCGKLRRRELSQEIEPMAIISNRAGSPDDVPWIAEKRGEVYGLSNTSYDDPDPWPKVEMGKEKLLKVVQKDVEAGLEEEQLVDKLYGILDSNTLPEHEGQDFEEYLVELRKSIFIPPIGKKAPPETIPKADQIAAAEPLSNGHSHSNPKEELKEAGRPEKITDTSNGMSGIYGTQRQTIILIDWEGRVTYRERALWDAEGEPIERGAGDMKFEFQIEGWDAKK